MFNVTKMKSTGVFNQEVVDWMCQLPQGRIVEQRLDCIEKGWDPDHPELLEHVLWVLAFDYWMDNEQHKPDSGWTWPTARDAREALRFMSK